MHVETVYIHELLGAVIFSITIPLVRIPISGNESILAFFNSFIDPAYSQAPGNSYPQVAKDSYLNLSQIIYLAGLVILSIAFLKSLLIEVQSVLLELDLYFFLLSNRNSAINIEKYVAKSTTSVIVVLRYGSRSDNS